MHNAALVKLMVFEPFEMHFPRERFPSSLRSNEKRARDTKNRQTWIAESTM